MNKKGLTLTELLISVALVSVVMLGMGGLMFSMQSGQQVTQESTLVGMNAAAAMTHIRRNAARAIGDANSPGIVTNADYFSIRRDMNNTPSDYTNDAWFIYTRTLGSRNTLHFCTQTENEGGEIPNLGGACSINNAEELLNNLTTFTPTLETANGFYLEVTLATRANPALNANTMTNPEYSLTTRITPIGHSN